MAFVVLLINVGLIVDRYWIQPQRDKELIDKKMDDLKKVLPIFCPKCGHVLEVPPIWAERDI